MFLRDRIDNKKTAKFMTYLVVHNRHYQCKYDINACDFIVNV